METQEFNRINNKKTIIDFIEFAENFIVNDYKGAKEEGLIDDFTVKHKVKGDEMGFLVLPAWKEEEDSIYDFPFYFSMTLNDEKILCKILYYTVYKEFELDLNDSKNEDKLSRQISSAFVIVKGKIEKILNERFSMFLLPKEFITIDVSNLWLNWSNGWCTPIKGRLTKESLDRARGHV